MENQNQVTVTPTVSFTDIATRLENARNAIVKNAISTGELIGNYASAMEYAFNKTLENGEIVKWFDLKGKAKAGVKAEYAKFVEALKTADLEGNKYVYWQRVKEASGYVTAGNKASANTTIDAKTMTELKTILNRIINNESDDEAELSNEAKPFLAQAFEIMGGDIDTI
jgi:hypothetical protein